MFSFQQQNNRYTKKKYTTIHPKEQIKSIKYFPEKSLFPRKALPNNWLWDAQITEGRLKEIQENNVLNKTEWTDGKQLLRKSLRGHSWDENYNKWTNRFSGWTQRQA